MAYASITKPSLHMNTKLYTGTGSSNAITGVGFQPDFTWIKQRSNAENHALFDAVRGVTKYIKSDENASEVTEATSLSAFGTDGFTVVSSGKTNTNGRTYASWNWKGNGAGSADTSGTINSTVSANTTSGFSIVKYVGDGTGGNNTIAHGLGVAPDMVIYKNLDTARNWIVYHKSMGATKNLYLDLTNASNTASNTFNNVAPTSTLLNVNDSVGVNESGDNHVAYCFAEKKGYSKFGKYMGNGNDDGPFIYTGFKPAWVIIKSHIGTDNWIVYDSKRYGSNGQGSDAGNARLYANTSSAEDLTADQISFHSNGFAPTKDYSSINYNDGNYIYMAFAEEPLVANVGESIPATAR